MKNILLIVKIVPKWRVGLYELLAEELYMRGYRLTVVYDYSATSLSNHSSSGELKKVKCINKRLKTLWNKFDYLENVEDTIDLLSPEIIITDASTRFLTAIKLIMKKKKYRYKLVGWSSGFFRHNNFLLDIYRKKFFNGFDGIIAYHSNAKEKFYNDYNFTNVLLAKNGIDERIIHDELIYVSKDEIKKTRNRFVKNNEILVLFVGKLTEGKKVNLLLDVALSVGSRFQFLVIGSGPYEGQLKEYASLKNIKNVTFLGRIDEGVNKYFHAADIFLLPGLGGLALVQALHNGLPIITSTADGSANDLVKNEVNGFISQKVDEEFIINSLDYLSDQNVRNEFSKNSMIIAKEYSIEEIANNIADFVIF